MEKREIKFRAWQKNQMLQMPLSSNFGIGRFFAFLDEDAIVMQFTGLKDKNGKEIFEGDIVRVLYTDWSSKSDDDNRTLEQYLIDIATIGVVGYNGNGFYIDEDYSMFTGKHGYIEVLGNIYENPEKLKK